MVFSFVTTLRPTQKRLSILIDLSCDLVHFSLNLVFFYRLRRGYVALPMNAPAFERGIAILTRVPVEKALPPIVGTCFRRIPLQSTNPSITPASVFATPKGKTAPCCAPIRTRNRARHSRSVGRSLYQDEFLNANVVPNM